MCIRDSPSRDRARRSLEHAAGSGPRDSRHLPLMALTLPAAASPRPRGWWPRLSLAHLRAAAKTAAAMPLGSQQLRRQRTSTLLSLAGVTASLLVVFAQLGIERAVYDSSVRLHRMVSGDLIIVPYGFKSMQLHAEVPVAVTDIIATVSYTHLTL